MGYTKPDQIAIRVPRSQANPSGVRMQPLDVVANTPMGVFKNYMDNIVGARIQTYYDTALLANGTPLANGTRISLFSNGITEDDKIFNTGVTYTKSKAHTNMVDDGKFEYGVSVIVLAFECLFIAPPQKALTYSGQLVSDAADHGTPLTDYNPSQFTRALMRQLGYEFKRGSDVTEENGLLIDLPASSGISGSFAAQDSCAIVQNSLGGPVRLLEFPKVLHSSENFTIDLINHGPALSIPIDCDIMIRMIAKRLHTS